MNEYIFQFQHRYWHTSETCGASWAGAQLCNDCTTTPMGLTDDDDDDDILKGNTDPLIQVFIPALIL